MGVKKKKKAEYPWGLVNGLIWTVKLYKFLRKQKVI